MDYLWELWVTCPTEWRKTGKTHSVRTRMWDPGRRCELRATSSKHFKGSKILQWTEQVSWYFLIRLIVGLDLSSESNVVIGCGPAASKKKKLHALMLNTKNTHCWSPSAEHLTDTHRKREKPSPVMLFLLVSWPSSRCGSLTRLLSGSGWLPSWRGRHRKPSSYPWHCQISPPQPSPPTATGAPVELSTSLPGAAPVLLLVSPAASLPGCHFRFFSFFFGGQWGGGEHWCSASPSTVACIAHWKGCEIRPSVFFFFLYWTVSWP